MVLLTLFPNLSLWEFKQCDPVHFFVSYSLVLCIPRIHKMENSPKRMFCPLLFIEFFTALDLPFLGVTFSH